MGHWPNDQDVAAVGANVSALFGLTGSLELTHRNANSGHLKRIVSLEGRHFQLRKGVADIFGGGHAVESERFCVQSWNELLNCSLNGWQ